jgi:hypothetical protein
LARPTPGKKNRTPKPPAGADQAVAPSQTSQTSPKTARTGAKEHLRERWLVAFRELGTVSAASEVVPVSRRTILEWRKTDPTFEEAFAEAEIKPIDRIEARGIRARPAWRLTRSLNFSSSAVSATSTGNSSTPA